MRRRKSLTQLLQIRLLAALGTGLLRRPREKEGLGAWMQTAAYTAAAFYLVSQWEY